MSRAVVLLQSLQPISWSDDLASEHFLARVTFTLQIGARTFTDLVSHIKLTNGSRGRERAFEVSAPLGYGGPFNHAVFHEVVATRCGAVIDEWRAAGNFRSPVREGATTEAIVMHARHDLPISGSSAGW